MRCTAKSKQSQQQCRLNAVEGYKVCHIHGGKTPKGEASPNFKHGRHSKYMPTRLAAIYDDLKDDAPLQILARNIKLREAFAMHLMETLEDGGDAAQAWADLDRAFKDLKKAMARFDEGGIALGMEAIQGIIEKRNRYHDTIAEVQDTLDKQRSDIAAQSKIELAGERAIAASELMTLMAGVLAVINNIVTNKEQRVNIADGIDKLLTGGRTSVIQPERQLTE